MSKTEKTTRSTKKATSKKVTAEKKVVAPKAVKKTSKASEYATKILKATEKYGKFDRTIAAKTFRKLSAELTPAKFNETVMREARNLYHAGKLKKVERGVYQLS